MDSKDKQSVDAAAAEQTKELSVDTFLSALYFNLVLGAVLYLAFCILRPRNRNIYAPRTYLVEESKRSPALPPGPFSWILPILKTPEEELLHKIGLDSYMFLRFLRMAIRVFIVFTFFGMVVLIPLNVANIPVSDTSKGGLDLLTMGNIPDSYTSRLWGHLFVFIGFIGFILYTLVTEVQLFTLLRHRYLTSREHRREPRSVTLLVTGIPQPLLSEARLFEIFNSFPGGVSKVVLARKPGNVISKYDVRNGAALSLEAAECNYILSGDRPSTRTKTGLPVPIPGLSDTEDAIKYSRARLLEAERVLEEERNNNKKNAEFRPSAFIIFNTQRGAQIAAQTVISSKPLHMSEKWGEVHPDDVIWSNLSVGGIYRWGRKTISIAACTALIIFWMFITFVATSVANISKLTELIPALNGILDHPSVVGAIQGILPPVVIALLMMVLSFILLRLSIFEGTPLNTSIQISLIHKYFFFLVVNVLLVVSFSGGILASIEKIIKSPPDTITILSEKMPGVSSFFINYLLLQSLSGAAKELIMVVPFVIKWIKRRALVKTPRHIWDLKAMPTMSWGQTIPQHTLAFVIGLTYCIIAPLVLPFALLYFVFYYIVYRYLFLYVIDQPSHAEMGGRAFPITVSHIFVGLYLAELITLGIFLLKKVIALPILIIILIVITAMVNVYIERAFRDLLAYVPMETLLKADRGGSMSITAVASPTKSPILDTFKHLPSKLSPFSKHTAHTEETMAEHSDSADVALLSQNNNVKLVNVSPDTYLHPALNRPCPVIWLPKDNQNRALTEQGQLLDMGILATVDGAVVRDTGRVGLVVDDVPLIDEEKAIEQLRGRISSKEPAMAESSSNSHEHHHDHCHSDPHTEVTTTRRVEQGPNGEQIMVEEIITTTTESYHKS